MVEVREGGAQVVAGCGFVLGFFDVIVIDDYECYFADEAVFGVLETVGFDCGGIDVPVRVDGCRGVGFVFYGGGLVGVG